MEYLLGHPLNPFACPRALPREHDVLDSVLDPAGADPAFDGDSTTTSTSTRFPPAVSEAASQVYGSFGSGPEDTVQYAAEKGLRLLAGSSPPIAAQLKSFENYRSDLSRAKHGHHPVL